MDFHDLASLGSASMVFLGGLLYQLRRANIAALHQRIDVLMDALEAIQKAANAVDVPPVLPHAAMASVADAALATVR